MRKYTDEDVKEAVANSTSYRQVLNKLNLVEAGGNYDCIKRLITKLHLDISHFTKQGWAKGKKLGSKRPIEDYFQNKHIISSHKLRIRLIQEGIFKPVCSSCGLDTWLSNPIPLELDHIDGNHLNNNLSNLRLLCPNCHTFTSTYRGKNISKQA